MGSDGARRSVHCGRRFLVPRLLVLMNSSVMLSLAVWR